LVTNGGGTINNNGHFKAGDTPGTFTETVEVVAVQRSVVKVAYATVTVTGTAGPLDHVVITPDSANVVIGKTKKYSAQAFDAANIAITGLTYTWSIVAGGGAIDSTGKFTAGATAGPFPNTIQVSVTQNTITRTDLASVTVTTAPPPEPSDKPNISKLTRLFSSILKGTGFEDFLGGQFTLRENGTVNTYKVIPGIVKAVSATTLTVLPNGATANVVFTLPAGTTILPKNTTLKVVDKVVVVTVNDQVKLVVKVGTPLGTPPGLQKHDKERESEKGTPPGWEKGKKVGWTKGNDTDDD
jgi:hypothetical protein